MSQQRKVIHVELLHDNRMNEHLYFGSVAAIYDHFTSDQIGIGKEALWHALTCGIYNGRKARIRQGVIIAKKSNRGIKKEV